MLIDLSLSMQFAFLGSKIKALLASFFHSGASMNLILAASNLVLAASTVSTQGNGVVTILIGQSHAVMLAAIQIVKLQVVVGLITTMWKSFPFIPPVWSVLRAFSLTVIASILIGKFP